MKKLIFYFALIGWLLSLVIHIASFDSNNVLNRFPIFILSTAIFVVWIPAILAIKNSEAYRQYKQSGKKINSAFLKVMFHQTPNWLKFGAAISFIYTFINFVLTMPKENISNPDNFRRLMSGHILGFYAIAAALLYPFANRSGEDINTIK